MSVLSFKINFIEKQNLSNKHNKFLIIYQGSKFISKPSLQTEKLRRTRNVLITFGYTMLITY